MKKIYLIGLSVLLMVSCSEADLSDTYASSTGIRAKNNNNDNDKYLLKKKFAVALHAAMVDHIEIRQFLKNEALKKFDNDFDVMYALVKDEKTGGSGTFRQMLLGYFESEAELEEIESEIPLLTIFIPTLPAKSFSAETWNVNEDIPLVAIRLLDNENTPIISSNSNSYLLGSDYVPGFPVVVVKEIERVTLPFSGIYTLLETKEYSTINGVRYKFIAEVFDNIEPKGGPTPVDTNENRVLKAWDDNKNAPDIEKQWHRDYVYYNINANNPNGPLLRNYQDRFTNFRIEGDTPYNALKNITDPSPAANNNLADPSLKTGLLHSTNISSNSFWTDGDFDFHFIISHRDGSTPSERIVDLLPGRLFDISYEEVIGPLKIYRVSNITQLTVPLLDRMDGIMWNLDDEANQWDLKVLELDLPFEETRSLNYSSKKNTNASGENSFGEKFKVGIKYGSTAETTISTSHTIKYTTKSNDLAMTKMFFGDNIIVRERQGGILNPGIKYSYRRYSSGQFSISLIPVKVQ